MRGERLFLCNEMLAGLGRWLRIAGYDTAIAERGWRDRDRVEQAHAEKRILLTRDRRLVAIRRANDRTVVLACDGIEACAEELARYLCLDWTLDPLSRCTLCSTRLELADHRLHNTLPPRIRALGSTVNVCPRCGRLYWEGSHIDRRRFIVASGLVAAAWYLDGVAIARNNDVLILDDFARIDLISTLGTPWRGFSDQVMGGISHEIDRPDRDRWPTLPQTHRRRPAGEQRWVHPDGVGSGA